MSEKLHQELLKLAKKNAELQKAPNPNEATQNHIKDNQEKMTEIAGKIGEALRPEWSRH